MNQKLKTYKSRPKKENQFEDELLQSKGQFAHIKTE